MKCIGVDCPKLLTPLNDVNVQSIFRKVNICVTISNNKIIRVPFGKLFLFCCVLFVMRRSN